jgi:hypothetical protein
VLELSSVNRMSPINARQLEILQWIADGCPDAVMKDFTYKTTAVALQGRRLVTVSRKGGIWRATITEAGRYYLQHGTCPPVEHTSSQPPAVSVKTTSAARKANALLPASSASAATPAAQRGITEQAEDLVTRVIQAGGVLHVDADNNQADYEQLIKAAKHAPNLPSGKQLRSRYTGHWLSHQREIYFDEDFAARISARPVPVPERVTVYHPAVSAHRSNADRHEVSKDSLIRASRILQALAAEAARRGYKVNAPVNRNNQYGGMGFSKLTDGHLQIVIEGFSCRLRLRERSAPGGSALPYGRQRDRLPRWRQARQTQFIPTGQLRITIDDGYAHDGRPAEFRDTKRASLEERLPRVLREVEIRAAEHDWRRQQEQRRAEERHQRWEQAIEHARHDFQQAKLTQALRRELEEWRLCKELDNYLAELQAGIPAIRDEHQQAAAAEWLAWAQQYRRRIDPLATPPSMPETPKPSPADLEPFLHGWSPHGPGN